jgi:AcrR family transcriptional regulator
MNIINIHSDYNMGICVMEKKEEVFRAAREIFYSKGFKETNIADVAKLAGIGVGTFYTYYSSKEEIFFEIYIRENEALKRRLVASVDLSNDPVMLVTKLVMQNLNEMNSNLILREWYNKELFSKLERLFYEKGGFESIDEITQDSKAELIKMWKSEGKVRDDLDVEMIMALFNSIVYVDIHKTEIGIQHFPQILQYLTEFIMKGITNPTT